MNHERDNVQADQETLARWMDLYGTDVLNVAYSYLRNFHQAEDVVQDVFLRAYRHMHDFQGQSSVKTWLLAITSNRCRDVLKSWTKKHEVVNEIPIMAEQATTNVLQEVTEHLSQNELWRVVERLPVKYREVVVMYYARDLSGAEIAEVLNTSEQSVRTRLHRARKLLKELFRKEGLGFETSGGRP